MFGDGAHGSLWAIWVPGSLGPPGPWTRKTLKNNWFFKVLLIQVFGTLKLWMALVVLSWGLLGLSWPCLGLSWGCPGAVLELSWGVLDHLGAYLALSWPILLPSGTDAGLCWAVWGNMLAHVESSWALSRAVRPRHSTFKVVCWMLRSVYLRNRTFRYGKTNVRALAQQRLRAFDSRVP